MSWTNTRDEDQDNPRADVRDDKYKAKCRSLIMREQRRLGWSYREIADFWSGKWHPEQVKRLIERVPRQVKSLESVA